MEVSPTETLSADSLSLEAVKRHVGYVFDYVIPLSSLDEAYLRWLELQLGWGRAALGARIVTAKLLRSLKDVLEPT